MQRKIVAIGGGQNGRLKSDGTRDLYETGPMDTEIIRLTGKKCPNFLFLGHSQLEAKIEAGYFITMKKIYKNLYNCDCKTITRNDLLEGLDKAKELINWADIIYEGGGNTLDMIKLWQETGFDRILRKAWENGKVMCGVSAGANCWFKECSSDSLKIKYGPNQPLIVMDCLGFIEGLFVPHCDEEGRYESVKELLKEKDTIGIQMSNCAALEIIDDKYRIITSDASSYGIKAYGLKTYWKSNEYLEQKIELTNEFRSLSELLSKNILQVTEKEH